MGDFDGLNPAFTSKQEARAQLVSRLTSWVRRTRQLCELAENSDSDHPTLTAEIIADATAGQEARLRAVWGLLQTFASADPQTTPVPDLPAP